MRIEIKLQSMGETAKGQPLICWEDLSIPSVIVVDANMGCTRCKERVYRLMRKITGVKEFIVDAARNQVIIKSRFQIAVDRSINEALCVRA